MRAPLTLTPTLTIEEDRRWDFIPRFTPAIPLEWESAIHRLAAAYSFSAELCAREPGRNHIFDRHDFFLDALCRADPQLTLTLTDSTEQRLQSIRQPRRNPSAIPTKFPPQSGGKVCPLPRKLPRPRGSARLCDVLAPTLPFSQSEFTTLPRLHDHRTATRLVGGCRDMSLEEVTRKLCYDGLRPEDPLRPAKFILSGKNPG